MTSSHQTCLLCLQTNENLINFYSESGKQLNMINILSTHFWFRLDEIKVLSQNICRECWKHTESFHGFYQSIREAHKKFETVPVKIESELSIVDNGETYQPVHGPSYQPLQMAHNNSTTPYVKIEKNHHDDEEESSTVYQISYTNSIDTEAKDKMSASEESDLDMEIALAAENAQSSLLPIRSKEKYKKTYNDFMKWCALKKVSVINEKVLLAYFSTVLNEFKSSTSWSYYSMLRATLNINNNINITEYNNLRKFLKRKSDNYQAKKSRILTKDQIFKFLKEAADDDFLAIKVVLIVGVFGACRRNELTNLDLGNIEYLENGIEITLPETQTNTIRQFVIDEGDDSDINLIHVFKKYAALRPADLTFTRFFINYRKGKCSKQPIGINSIASYPKKIATFLNLPNVEEYTGHCFRRSSKSWLAESGVNRGVRLFVKKTNVVISRYQSNENNISEA